MTNSQRMRLSAVMISSTMPSTKYSCSGSPDMFWNGNTAIDGLSGSDSAAGWTAAVPVASTSESGRNARGPISGPMRYTRTGLTIFLRLCSPRSSKTQSSRSRTWSCTIADTQIPPGSATPSSRAAMLTPSPWMSPSSTMMSPELIPTRNSMRRSSGVAAFRDPIPLCTVMAQATASTTLGNSIRRPSPVVLTMRPLCSATIGSISSRRKALRRAKVPASSRPMSRL